MDLRKIGRKIVGLLIIVVIVVTALLLYRQFFTLYLNSTNPSTSSVSYLSPFIELRFNKNIDEKSFKLDDNSNIIDDGSIKYEKGVVRLYLDTENLTIDKSVYFTFSAASSSNDDYRITNKVIRFAPRDISFEDLPKDQQTELKRLEGNRPDYYTDPVLQYLPYSTLDYQLETNFTDTGFVIDTTVYISNADESNRVVIIQQRYNQAIEYIRSKGIDTKKYIFRLIVSDT